MDRGCAGPEEPLKAERIPTRTWVIAAIVGVGVLMAMLDSTLANLALESIRADLASTIRVVQWVVTGYLIALAVSLPASGWLGRRYGFGRVWFAALVAFTIGSAACGLAHGPGALLGARVLQGLAAGLMIPAGQAVIASTAGPTQLGRLFGTLGLAVSLGPAVGPALGGLILAHGSWRWLFWINVPIGLAALLAARHFIPLGATNRAQPLDRIALALLGSGLPLLLYGATRASSAGLSPISSLIVGAGAVLIVAFVVRTLTARYPLIDVALMLRPSFAAAAATTGFTGANMYAGLLLLPLYLQIVAGRDIAEVGMLLFAMGLGTAVALPAAGALTDRLGAGRAAVAGATLLAITTAPFLLPEMLSGIAIALLLALRGVGLALAQMPATTAAYASVPPEHVGDATTLVNVVQRVGGALGAAAMVAALGQVGGSQSVAAYRLAFAWLLGLSALAVVSTILLRREGSVPEVARGQA